MERRAMKLAVVVTLLLAGFLAGPARAVDQLEAMGGLRPATRVAAPDVAFATLDGREARVGALRGKAVLLGFFTTW